jgi:hypothetical protein
VQDYVSTRWIRVAGLAGVFWVVWADYVPYAFPWLAVAWLALATAAAVWLRLTSPRSIAQMLRDVEGEPRLAVAPVAVLSVDRKGMAL